jgi:hypothetical protein
MTNIILYTIQQSEQNKLLEIFIISYQFHYNSECVIYKAQ